MSYIAWICEFHNRKDESADYETPIAGAPDLYRQIICTLRRTDPAACPFLRGPAVVPEITNREAQGQEDTAIDANYELRQEEAASRILVQRTTQQVSRFSHCYLSSRPSNYCNVTRMVCIKHEYKSGWKLVINQSYISCHRSEYSAPRAIRDPGDFSRHIERDSKLRDMIFGNLIWKN